MKLTEFMDVRYKNLARLSAILREARMKMGMTIEQCESCTKDWTKCGTCPVMMQWVKEHKHE